MEGQWNNKCYLSSDDDNITWIYGMQNSKYLVGLGEV